jgi:maltose/maltodextrin transport system permease protein
MLKGYFDTIPVSMEESATIDGATQFQTFTQILLPMSVPIFAVVFILSFISFMSEYPVASIILQARENWTLAVGANSFLAEHQKLWGRFAALAVLSGVPITVMFMVCQKFVVSGLTSGGVKE